MRWRYVPLVALLGVATAVLPTIASSETSPTIEAVNEGGLYEVQHHRWSPTQVAVMAGGVVTFRNTTTVEHGVEWTGGPEVPSCPGVAINEGRAGWSGACTFTQPGTYTFRCVVHPTEMKGTITVNAGGTTTISTPTPTTTTSSTTPVEPPAGSPLLSSPSLRSSQRGGSVKGSLDISKAGAGDRLEIDVFAKSATLATAKRSARVRVGRFVRGSVSAGAMSFSVKLNAKARRALKRHRRLALTVKITLTPLNGAPFTVTRGVVEHT